MSPDTDPDFRHSQVAAGAHSLHVVEAGDPAAEPFLFLHGWPESWRSWASVLRLASGRVRAIAVDLPGIGGSAGSATDGSKTEIADAIHDLVVAMGLERPTLVGQDAGGMVVYPYLRRHRDLARAVIMSVVVPGVDPWDKVLSNPYIWHFAFHASPDLPEMLVEGRQRPYFDHFFDLMAKDPSRITDEVRQAHAEAYPTGTALTAGFDWYRMFRRDAEDNRRAAAEGPPVETPLLYARGEHETGVEEYLDGLRRAGIVNVRGGVIAGAAHFGQEEAPEATWRLIAEFAGLD
jgi:pimeloyl-ACP methyl ester carboxylesterase